MATWTTPVTTRTLTTHTSYGTDDLNRVEENSQYLSDWLNTLGYINVVNTDYTWVRTEFFTESDETQFLSNLSEIINILTLPVTTPTVPTTLDDMTITKANNIEKIQLALYNATTGLVYEADLKRAGTFGAVAGADIGLI